MCGTPTIFDDERTVARTKRSGCRALSPSTAMHHIKADADLAPRPSNRLSQYQAMKDPRLAFVCRALISSGRSGTAYNALYHLVE